MYKSPIEIVYGSLQTQMVQEDEKMIMEVIRKAEANIDEGELKKALQYDRNQYLKGYEDGKNDVLDKISTEIITRYPKNYAGELELGGRICEFSLNDVLQIIDKYRSEE